MADVTHLDRLGTIGKLKELLAEAEAGNDDEMLIVVRRDHQWSVWATRSDNSHLTAGYLFDLAIARLGWYKQDGYPHE